MKNLILILLIILAKICFGQDIINPYINYSGSLVNPLIVGNPSFNTQDPSGAYNGEYVIFLDKFPWGNIQNLIGGMNNDLHLEKFALSYQIELVSFPFSTDCAFPSLNDTDGGCAGLSGRVFNVPPDNYFQINNSFWEYPISTSNIENKLYNLTPILSMERRPDLLSAVSDPNFSACLVSINFKEISGANDRKVLPHSILKHTINLHCGPTKNNPILGSFHFYTDLTRGRMREYPFKNNVYSSSNTVDYDVMIRPFLIGSDYFYNNTSTENCNYSQTNIVGYSCNNDTLNAGIEGNNINYTPYDPAADDFCQANIPDYIDTQLGDSVSAPPSMRHLPLPDYSLIASTSVRNANGTTLAGYISYTGQSTIQMIYNSPIVHQYTIDKNISLNNINHSERTIYNPSEVDILADDLHFPTNYTFKTIRGRFPYATEVNDAAQDPKNGGPFTDSTKRDVPVPTDLYKDFHVGAQYDSTDHKLASLYHLQSGSKLTIEPCVKIFDATFEINPGSEIVFENWKTNLINVDRYQLIYNGGIVTKRDDSFLFQDSIETNRILRYEAGDSISAGENVDVNAASGEYTIEQGADVTFKAANQITLEHGFEVKPGGDFLASIGPVTIPACGPLRLKSRNFFNENQIDNQHEKAEEISYFVCSPNPVTENTFFMFEIKDKSNATISVYDVMGNLIQVIGQSSFLTKGRYTYSFNVKELSSGLYIAKLQTGNSEKSLKFIKQ